MLKKDVPYGKIIEAPITKQLLKVVPVFPVQIPGTVSLTAAPIFPAAFDYDLLKFVCENSPVIPYEGFKFAGF